MMVALRRADLLVAVGAELEVGWLPAAIQGASGGPSSSSPFQSRQVRSGRSPCRLASPE